jgi:hypothetical protein
MKGSMPYSIEKKETAICHVCLAFGDFSQKTRTISTLLHWPLLEADVLCSNFLVSPRKKVIQLQLGPQISHDQANVISDSGRDWLRQFGSVFRG